MFISFEFRFPFHIIYLFFIFFVSYSFSYSTSVGVHSHFLFDAQNKCFVFASHDNKTLTFSPLTSFFYFYILLHTKYSDSDSTFKSNILPSQFHAFNYTPFSTLLRFGIFIPSLTTLSHFILWTVRFLSYFTQFNFLITSCVS